VGARLPWVLFAKRFGRERNVRSPVVASLACGSISRETSSDNGNWQTAETS